MLVLEAIRRFYSCVGCHAFVWLVWVVPARISIPLFCCRRVAVSLLAPNGWSVSPLCGLVISTHTLRVRVWQRYGGHRQRAQGWPCIGHFTTRAGRGVGCKTSGHVACSSHTPVPSSCHHAPGGQDCVSTHAVAKWQRLCASCPCQCGVRIGMQCHESVWQSAPA